MPASAPPAARPEIDAASLAALLDRVETAQAAFAEAGAAVAAAVRTADAAALAASGDRLRAAADGLRTLAADRAALLRAGGGETLADLARDSGLTHLIARVGSLRESAAETRRAAWTGAYAAKRSAATCEELIDLIARGGRPAVTYGGGDRSARPEPAAGGALLSASA